MSQNNGRVKRSEIGGDDETSLRWTHRSADQRESRRV